MVNKTLISVRLDTDTLAKLDKLARESRYYTRNSIINGILSAVVNCADQRSLNRMMSFSERCHDGTPIQFVYESKPSRIKRAETET